MHKAARNEIPSKFQNMQISEDRHLAKYFSQTHALASIREAWASMRECFINWKIQLTQMAFASIFSAMFRRMS